MSTATSPRDLRPMDRAAFYLVDGDEYTARVIAVEPDRLHVEPDAIGGAWGDELPEPRWVALDEIQTVEDVTRPVPFVVGQRCRFPKGHDLGFVGVMVPAGALGTVTTLDERSVSIRLDEQHEGLDTWDNEVVFAFPEDDERVGFLVEPLPAEDLDDEQRKAEAIAHLRAYAERATDPGDRGYSEGMAERLERPDEVVPARYLEQVRTGHTKALRPPLGVPVEQPAPVAEPPQTAKAYIVRVTAVEHGEPRPEVDSEPTHTLLLEARDGYPPEQVAADVLDTLDVYVVDVTEAAGRFLVVGPLSVTDRGELARES